MLWATAAFKNEKSATTFCFGFHQFHVVSFLNAAQVGLKLSNVKKHNASPKRRVENQKRLRSCWCSTTLLYPAMQAMDFPIWIAMVGESALICRKQTPGQSLFEDMVAPSVRGDFVLSMFAKWTVASDIDALVHAVWAAWCCKGPCILQFCPGSADHHNWGVWSGISQHMSWPFSRGICKVPLGWSRRMWLKNKSWLIHASMWAAAKAQKWMMILRYCCEIWYALICLDV